MSRNYIRIVTFLISSVLLISPVYADELKVASQTTRAQTLLSETITNNNLSEQDKNKIALLFETRRQGIFSGGEFWKLYETIRCESSFKHEGLHGPSQSIYGIAQFKRETFAYFSKKAQKQLDYKSVDDQLYLFVWAYKEGYINHWECWTKKYGNA